MIGAAAILSTFVSAAPMPDSAFGGEVAVSAPNGVLLSDTPTPSPTLSSAATSSMAAAAAVTTSPPMIDNSGSGGYSGNMPPSYNDGHSGGSSHDSPPSYGSGMSNWGQSGYDSCVQKCIASYGAPPSSYSPPSQSGGSDSGGSGATHTVIVAPTQGVLRYVPFALNASVGDTIKFMWGANNHTVTKSSELLPCNKTSDSPFASGEQNKDFVFTQVVNSTDTVFFYCGTPTHCEKGMFGIINPPNAFGGSTTVSNMLSTIVSNSSDLTAMATYTNQLTAGNPGAAAWGSHIDMAQVPSWAHESLISNVMYTRAFLASNPETLQTSGLVDLGAAGSNPLMIPQDITASTSTSSSAYSPGSTMPPAGSATPSASAAAQTASSSSKPTNGASSLASPRVLVGVMTVVATFFAL